MTTASEYIFHRLSIVVHQFMPTYMNLKIITIKIELVNQNFESESFFKILIFFLI